MSASETGSVIFTDDISFDCSTRMNSEVYRNILSIYSEMHQKQLWEAYIIQQDNDANSTYSTWTPTEGHTNQKKAPTIQRCQFREEIYTKY